MAFCPADCEDVTITQNSANCELKERMNTVARLMLFTCDTELPNPMTDAGMQALIDSGKLAFTNPLANFAPSAPEFVDVVIADCVTALKRVGSRVIDFQDRVAVDIPAGTSPVSAPVYYYNRLFWNDKVSKATTLRYGFVMCNGQVFVAVDENGEYLQATLTAYLAYENIGTAQAVRNIEYIVGQLTFLDDPMALFIRPQVDTDGELINLNSFGLY